jgi:hypothetical protein
MNGHVVQLEDAAHQSTQSVLPWLLNGSLQGEERQRAESHLAECPRCQREAAWLRQVGTAYDALEMEPELEGAFDKLRPHLEPRSTWRERMLAPFRQLVHDAQSWTRWTVAVQSCALLALAVVLVANREPEKTYITLGAPAAAATGNAVVQFDPAIGEARVRSILAAHGARIVNGPVGTSWVLALPSADGESMRTLRAEAGVVLAAPLQETWGR